MSIKSLSMFALLKNKREEREREKAEKKERKQNRSSVQLTRKGTKEQTGRQKEADHETKAL